MSPLDAILGATGTSLCSDPVRAARAQVVQNPPAGFDGWQNGCKEHCHSMGLTGHGEGGSAVTSSVLSAASFAFVPPGVGLLGGRPRGSRSRSHRPWDENPERRPETLVCLKKFLGYTYFMSHLIGPDLK